MSAHIEWLAARETSVQVFTPGEDWVGAGEHRQPVLTLAGDDVVAIQGTPAELRARMNALEIYPVQRLKIEIRRSTIGGVSATWFVPKGEIGEAVVCYLHGGGYVFGTVRSYADWLIRLALSARCRVVAVDYRLGPEFPFPAALDDALAVYRALLAEEGISHQQLFVAGDSAGGGLSVALLVAARDAGLPLPLAAMLISPWCDLSLSLPSIDANWPSDWLDRGVLAHCARLYLGDHDVRDPRASPLFAQLEGLPPLAIQYGSAEVLRDECYALGRRALDAGVRVQLSEFPEMVHGFQMMSLIFGEGSVATEELGAFVRSFTSAEYSRA